jgi:hypothetical protein
MKKATVSLGTRSPLFIIPETRTIRVRSQPPQAASGLAALLYVGIMKYNEDTNVRLNRSTYLPSGPMPNSPISTTGPLV